MVLPTGHSFSGSFARFSSLIYHWNIAIWGGTPGFLSSSLGFLLFVPCDPINSTPVDTTYMLTISIVHIQLGALLQNPNVYLPLHTGYFHLSLRAYQNKHVQNWFCPFGSRLTDLTSIYNFLFPCLLSYEAIKGHNSISHPLQYLVVSMDPCNSILANDT